MNEIPILLNHFLEEPERALRSLLSQVDARSGDDSPRLPARGLLIWQDAVGSDLVAHGALLDQPNDPLNTVNQTIVCHVVPGTEGRHGVVL